MQEQTFSIDINVTNQLLSDALKQIKKVKEFLPDTVSEIEYLESEIEVISSFIQYHEIQPERQKTLLNHLTNSGEYGTPLATSDSTLKSAHKRLEEMKIRLSIFSKRKETLDNKVDFLKNDIQLLENMTSSSPRAKIHEYAVLQSI